MRGFNRGVNFSLHRKKSLILLSFFMILIFYSFSSLFLVSALNVNNDSSDVHSEIDVSYFKHATIFDIKRECFYEGAPCNPGSVNCNLTVYSIDSQNYSYLVMDGEVMTGNTNYYNKTVYDVSLPNGLYRGSMYCSDGVSHGSEIFYMEINQAGDGRGNSLFLILALAGVIVLAFGIFFENEYIGFIAGAIFIVTGIYVMIYGFSNLSDMYTRTISYACMGLGFIFEIAAGYKVAGGALPSADFD